MLELPPTLAAEALSESVPTAFAPAEFRAEDYNVEWEGPAPPGVRASIEPGSLEWVRVSELLVIPRARLSVEGAAGQVSCGGFGQALPARIPIALISGAASPCTVTVAGEAARKLHVRFQPPTRGLRAFFDASCSRYGVRVEPTGDARPEQADWLYVGCRLVSAQSGGSRTSSLEAYLFWDGIGQSIDVAGVPTPATIPSVWALRLAPEPGLVRLKGGNRELTLRYSIPEHLHRAGLAAGIGPYSYIFESSSLSENTAAPILTLYGSYALQDSMRIVAFEALTFNTSLYTDLGLYLSTEYARILDRRVTLNLMLGAHAIGFRSGGEYYFEPGVPQGTEAVLTDAFTRGAELRAGAFVYPNINGNEYYNAWLRWGMSAFFVELNYISWQESLRTGTFYSRSLGVTLGVPLLQFL